MPRQAINEVGKRYGKLVVLEQAPSDGTWAKFLCQCDCGNTITVRGNSLRTGMTRSCGCLAHLPPGEAAFNQIYNSARQNARTRGYPWELTKEQVKDIMGKPCAYCGAEPHQRVTDTRYHGTFLYNGMDRVNNTKGYTIDNVVPCCGRCNRAKDTHSVGSFREWVARVHAHLSAPNIHHN